MMKIYCVADNTSQLVLYSLKAGNGGIRKDVKERITIMAGRKERVNRNDGRTESVGTANLRIS